MANESFTPRTLIQGILDNNPDQVEETVRLTRRQALPNSFKPNTRSGQKAGSRKRPSSESEVRTAVKKRRANTSRLSTSYNAESTPRTLISGFLGTQDSEKTLRIEQRVTRSGAGAPSPDSRRRARRQSLLKEATTRRLRRSVADVVDESTPRTLITGFIQHGDEETPVLPLRQSQQRRSSVHHAYDSLVIETSQLRSHSRLNKTSASDLENSFMGAYSQFSQQSQSSQPNRMQTRHRREHILLVPKTTKNLNRSKPGKGETKVQLSGSKSPAMITTTAEVHAEALVNASEVAEATAEEQQPLEEQQQDSEAVKSFARKARRRTKQQADVYDDGGGEELRNMEDNNNNEAKKPIGGDGGDIGSDASEDMSEDFTNASNVSRFGSLVVSSQDDGLYGEDADGESVPVEDNEVRNEAIQKWKDVSQAHRLDSAEEHSIVAQLGLSLRKDATISQALDALQLVVDSHNVHPEMLLAEDDLEHSEEENEKLELIVQKSTADRDIDRGEDAVQGGLEEAVAQRKTSGREMETLGHALEHEAEYQEATEVVGQTEAGDVEMETARIAVEAGTEYHKPHQVVERGKTATYRDVDTVGGAVEDGSVCHQEGEVAEQKKVRDAEAGPAEHDLSIVPPSEVSEDETDSREGLPRFNETFTPTVTSGRKRQTRLESFYSTNRTPTAPDLNTPEIPQSAVQRTRFTPTSLPRKKAEARLPLTVQPTSRTRSPAPRSAKVKRKSALPRLPAVNTASIFKHFTDLRVSKEAMAEVEKVADDFWKQVIVDVGTYADHAGRSSVDESDVALLMHRQRLTSEYLSMYTLVEKYLPLEYQMEIIDVATSGNVVIP